MSRHGSANGGAPAPEPRPRERVTRCCARCRRGVPGYGELPCGYPTGCPNAKCDHATPGRLLGDLQEYGYPKENN